MDLLSELFIIDCVADTVLIRPGVETERALSSFGETDNEQLSL